MARTSLMRWMQPRLIFSSRTWWTWHRRSLAIVWWLPIIIIRSTILITIVINYTPITAIATVTRVFQQQQQLCISSISMKFCRQVRITRSWEVVIIRPRLITFFTVWVNINSFIHTYRRNSSIITFNSPLKFIINNIHLWLTILLNQWIVIKCCQRATTTTITTLITPGRLVSLIITINKRWRRKSYIKLENNLEKYS